MIGRGEKLRVEGVGRGVVSVRGGEWVDVEGG